MIIWRIRPLANDHPEDPASCKWSSGGSGLLQMIIQQIQPLANDHMEVQATCKWSSGGSDHLQMIIQRIRPLANDHPEHLASGMWSSGGTGLLQMIIGLPRHPNYLSQDPESNSRTFLEQFALVSFLIWDDELVRVGACGVIRQWKHSWGSNKLDRNNFLVPSVN